MCRGRPIGGAAPAYSVTGGWYGERFNRYVGEQWSRLFGGFPTSTYFPACAIPPRTPGGIASQSRARATANLTVSMVSGRNLEGSAACLLTVPDAVLSLIVSLEGTATMTLTVTDATLAAGIFGTGSTSATMTVDPATIGALAGIFSDVTCTMDTGTSTLTAIGHLAGDILPYTELSPENLARAVWEALASQYNTTGSMGEKLNLAGSGGVDLNALAAAVLAAAQSAPIHADIRKVNGYTVTGEGTAGTPWGPA